MQGGEPYFSNDTQQVLNRAQDFATRMGDEFVSVEPLLLALLSVNSTASRILKDAGITESELRKAVMELRQGQKVESQSGDENFQALWSRNRATRTSRPFASTPGTWWRTPGRASWTP